MCNPLTILKVSIRSSYVLLFAVFVTAIFGCGDGSSSTDLRDIGEPPEIVMVTLEYPKNIYGLEDSIGIKVTFDQIVSVVPKGENVPKISLTFGGHSRDAKYISGAETKILFFQYKIVIEDGIDTKVEMAATIDLDGASILSSSGKKAILSFIPIEIGGVDTSVPSPPSGLAMYNPSNNLSNDRTPEILVSGVEPLATVELYSDNLCQVSVSSPVSVLLGESSVIIEANALTSDGSITYYARQTNVVEQNSPCSQSSITYQYTFTPVITRVSAIDGSYSTGEPLTVSVEFGRQVTVDTVDGVPRLTLIIGSSTKNAIYQSGTGSHIINFTYNIESGDMDNNGINVVGPIDMNGGSIKGASFLNALLTFPSPQDFERVFINFKEKIFSTSRSFALIRSGASVVTWGWNSYGGDSSLVASSLSSGVTKIFSTKASFAALKDDGSVVTWGSNSSGGAYYIPFPAPN